MGGWPSPRVGGAAGARSAEEEGGGGRPVREEAVGEAREGAPAADGGNEEGERVWVGVGGWGGLGVNMTGGSGCG
jgi:hypothetical protein